MKFLTALFALVMLACGSVVAQCPNGQCQPQSRFFQGRVYHYMPAQTCPNGQCQQSCPNGTCPAPQSTQTATPTPSSSGIGNGAVILVNGKKFKVTLTPTE